MRRSRNKGSPPETKTPAKDGAEAGAGLGSEIDGQGNKYRTPWAPARFCRVWRVSADLLVIEFAEVLTSGGGSR